MGGTEPNDRRVEIRQMVRYLRSIGLTDKEAIRRVVEQRLRPLPRTRPARESGEWKRDARSVGDLMREVNRWVDDVASDAQPGVPAVLLRGFTLRLLRPILAENPGLLFQRTAALQERIRAGLVHDLSLFPETRQFLDMRPSTLEPLAHGVLSGFLPAPEMAAPEVRK